MAQSATLQDRNIDTVFEALDSNRSNEITLDDLDGLARGICARIGVSGGDKEQRLVDAYHTWWDGLQQNLDTNNDAKITREEFTAGFQQPGVREISSERSRAVAHVIAELLDTDGDNKISSQEYIRLVTGFGPMDDRTAEQGFKRLDTDGDGVVSVAELEVAWHQMMTTADPAAPGTALLGRS